MEKYLQFFIYIPLLGYLISLLINKKREAIIANIASATSFIQLVFLISFSFLWYTSGAATLDIKQVTLLTTPEFDFFIDFLFDRISLVFLLVGSMLTLLVSVFSKYYIHREPGFKRYFNNVQLFFLGYSIVVVAGNFETLFLGWEMIGITSFLLISFYRNRYLPVKNAMKVVSLYRLGDVFLILAMWLSHHLWHGNISFYQILDVEKTALLIENHKTLAIFISISIVIGAAIKSAMYPFSSWVARAMEGPSSSSAIFYGSLSIHLGVFLLLRTFPFWQHLMIIKIVIITLGLLTSLICNSIAKAQPTVKTQIAYASITQIGIIFIEIALGFHQLALFHFVGNAFFRTYQILVSPSVLNYLIHNQFFTGVVKNLKLPSKLSNTFYMLSIKEYNMDITLFKYFWLPFKKASTRLLIFNNRFFYILISILFLLGIYLDINTFQSHPLLLKTFVYLFSLIALILILLSFNERKSSIIAWLNVVYGHLFIMMSISINSHIQFKYLLLYLVSICFFGVLGYKAIKNLEKETDVITLDQYHGNSQMHPKLSILFLVACLGLIGFPISPLYIGIDLLLTYIESDQYLIMISVALSLIFIEISLLRIYTRLFCGIPSNTSAPISFKSA
jgi:NADH:ubiquinone oxidoreductase subunit 5 (subunit L)/multisubunit Na+/H+ antiporter MnhA subunit